MEIDKGIKLEETESKDFVNTGVRLKEEFEECIRCLELQDKITNANNKCVGLELAIGKKNSVIEQLEGKLGYMELKKLEMEDEIRALKQRNEELEKSIQNGKDEDDKVTQLLIENNVLECEKNKAVREIEVWKVKSKELEMQALELQKRLSAKMMKTGSGLPEMDSAKMGQVGGLIHGFNGAPRPSVVQTETENKVNEDKDVSGTFPINTPFKQYADAEGVKGDHRGELKPRVRKCLDFAGKGSPYKNISPSTPVGRPTFGPIDISDSDDDLNIAHLHLPDLNRCETVPEHPSDEEGINCYDGRLPYRSTPKRRRVRGRAAYIVTSENESDADDNTPICRLRSNNMLARNSDTKLNSSSLNGSCSRDSLKELTPRRRLMRVGNREDKGVSGKCSYKSTGSRKDFGIPETMNENVDEDEMDEEDSSSEGESLGGFIVKSSDDSESCSASNCNDISENDGTFSNCSVDSENTREDTMTYDEIISGLRRERKDKMKWEYQGDMLADFGKCPELCMKAVCALYRQQTTEEKSFKATLSLNGRGFSQIHAFRGSALAEFLTDGDPQGDVKKSVKQLQEFDPTGVEQCRKLATHYSNQLFQIYQKKEDPFFHP